MNRNGINNPLEFNFQNAMPLSETHPKIDDKCSNLTFFYDDLNKNSLTISNIYHFTEAANGLLQNDRKKNTFSVLVLDIEKSGEINKSYGKSIPNKLVDSIDSTLKSHIKEPNLYCYMKGINFAILLENYKSIDIALLVIQLTEEISNFYPELSIRPAFGICTAGQSDLNISSLYKRAFYAMSTIKGQNRQLLANYAELIIRKRKIESF